MKVVIVNTYDTKGGAAIASQRLQKSLEKSGITVSRLVMSYPTTTSNTTTVANTGWKKFKSKLNFYWERASIFLCNKLNRKDLFKVSIANTGFNIANHPLIKEADVIHLHWINHGLLSINNIRQLTQLNKPIYWTMHDLWAATGICHYPAECKKYESLCQECPFTGQEKHPDIAKKVFRRKEKINFSTTHFIGCSQWITEKAQKSKLLKKAFFHHIPNPIDTTLYTPGEQTATRNTLGLPSNKKLLLFVADNIQDKRKGITYLIEACQHLKTQNENIINELGIVLIGKGSQELIEAFTPFHIHSMGYISDTAQMINIYSAVDLFVIPSLEDNLPNTIMESLACGVPCCGFNTGGIPEMIDHQKNGYIAEKTNGEELAKGINWILSYPDPALLKEQARKKVLQSYNEQTIAKQHIDLYKQFLP